MNQTTKQEQELKITNEMLGCGIPAHLNGYEFIRFGVQLIIEDKETVSSVTKLLYPEIAKKFHTTDQKVERAIRNAIEVAWNRNTENFKQRMGFTIWKNRPTNSEFLAQMADKVKLGY